MTETLDRESRRVSKGHQPCLLQIKTAPDGFNFGRMYYLKADVDVSGLGEDAREKGVKCYDSQSYCTLGLNGHSASASLQYLHHCSSPAFQVVGAFAL